MIDNEMLETAAIEDTQYGNPEPINAMPDSTDCACTCACRNQLVKVTNVENTSSIVWAYSSPMP